MIRNLIIFTLLTIITFVCVGCMGATPEQKAALDKLQQKLDAAQLELAVASKLPGEIMFELQQGNVTPDEYRVMMGKAHEKMASAKKSVDEAKQAFDDAKAAGASTIQLALAAGGGALGRTALHAIQFGLTAWLGAGSPIVSLFGLLLGGSKSSGSPEVVTG